MKPVVHLLRAIQHVLERNRQQGATTRLKELAEKHEVFLVGASRDHARDFGPAGVSLLEIVRETEGHRPRALFFDNHALGTLCTRVLEQFDADAQAVRDAEKVHQAMLNRLDQELATQVRNYQSSQATLSQKTREYQDLNRQFYNLREELVGAENKLKMRNTRISRITVKRRK